MAKVYSFNCNGCGSAMKIALASTNAAPLNTAIQIKCTRCNVLVFTNVAAPSINQKTNKKVPTKSPLPLGASFDNIKVPPPQKRIKDRYAVIRKLGSGTMGQVFLAYDEKEKEQVAIKFLSEKNEDEDRKKSKEKEDKAKEFFRREAVVLNDLQHPNIIGFKGCGNHEGNLFIVMEYADGMTLLEHIAKKKQIIPRHAAQLIVHILNALQYAHDHKIIHRDIKPANISITKNREVKLIDLGLGKIVDESVELTKTGEIMGTCSYMPLEQIQKTKSAGNTADIYAVGATLYHAIVGIAPFEEYNKNLAQLFTAKIQDKYIKLKDINSDFPDEIVRIVEKAMKKLPEDRYQTAEEMRLDLQNFIQNQRKQ